LCKFYKFASTRCDYLPTCLIATLQQQYYFVQLGFSVSNVTDKTVQLNTDLLKPRHEYLYKKGMAQLKLNEIKRVITNGEFNKRDRLKFGEAFQKGGQGSFGVKHFTTATKI
jgi:hypothetical protein